MQELIRAFKRGARYGLIVAMSTVALSIVVAVTAVTGPTPVYAEQPTPVASKTLEASVDVTPAPDVVSEPLPLDPALALALSPWRESVEPDAPLPILEPPVVTHSAPRVSVAPRIVPSVELYERLAAAFPEQPEVAYAVVMCESSGNASANTGNGYYGMWQFDLGTWQSVGGTGLPSDASVDEQIMRARMLFDSRGWSPWGCA
ncbi:MAG: transglycosylase family protein [Dehalococcoidia bacterium]|nr:transglycosylase family protein [Dehalococcoidia bacterium]